MVRLGSFARAGIEDCFGGDLAVGVRAALVHYARALRSGLLPRAHPGFLPRSACPEGSAEAEAAALDLPLDDEDERTFAEAAASAETPITCLVAHAVLSYLAELERLGVAPPPDAPEGGVSGGRGRGPAG